MALRLVRDRGVVVEPIQNDIVYAWVYNMPVVLKRDGPDSVYIYTDFFAGCTVFYDDEEGIQEALENVLFWMTEDIHYPDRDGVMKVIH